MRTAEKDGRTLRHSGSQASFPQQKRTEVLGNRRNVGDGLNEFVKMEENAKSGGNEQRSNDVWLMPRKIRTYERNRK